MQMAADYGGHHFRLNPIQGSVIFRVSLKHLQGAQLNAAQAGPLAYVSQMAPLWLFCTEAPLSSHDGNCNSTTPVLMFAK